VAEGAARLSGRAVRADERGRRVHALSALRTHAAVLARIGCAAVGSVYVLIGTVALVALTGHLIEYADPSRIALVLKRIPGGVVLIWALAAGAAAYAGWRFLEAIGDPYEIGRGWRGASARLAGAASGVAYALLSYGVAHAVLASPAARRDASEHQQQELVARVLHWPGGPWLIAAAGLFVGAVALVQFWFVISQSYARDVRMQPRTRHGARLLCALGGYGYSARGVILCVISYFLLHAALTHNPAAVGDTDTAFDFIGGGVIGNSAFAVVAIGTIAYGAFMYANAWLYDFEAEVERPRR
jgi:hypothetical protein